MRIKNWMAWGLGLLGLVLGLAGSVSARADYTISPYHLQINVTKSGDAQVTQTMTYAFDDDYHGIFNVQDLRGIRGGRLERVTTQLNGQTPMTARAATTGARNTYQVTQSADKLKVKVYRPVSEGDRLKVTYRMHLTGVVTNYRDTAELNWKVIGTGWSEPLHNVRVTIQLPATKVPRLQAWTHGPLAGHTQVDRQRGRIVLTVKRNPADSFVESHLLFPTTVTPTAHMVAQNRKAAVQKQEAQLVATANARRDRQRRTLIGGLIGAWVLTGGGALGAWWWFWRHPANRYAHPIPIPHSFDIPTVPPAQAESVIDYQSPTTEALSGELLMAVTRKELTITPVEDGRHTTVRLTRTGDVQNYFLKKCFEVVAKDGDSLTLRDLKRYGKRDKKGRLGKWFRHWQHEVDRAVEGYQDGENEHQRGQLLWLGWGLTGLLTLCAGLGWLVRPTMLAVIPAMILMVVAWLVILRVRGRIDRYNAAGLVLVNDTKGFRQMLKDIGHFNTAQIGDLILWEEILPYAAAFGLAQQVAAKLAIDFTDDVLRTQLGGFYPIYFAPGDSVDFSLGDSLNTGLSGALQASDNRSSSSGNSGGFTGGSSGGFGGGSGGGAF